MNYKKTKFACYYTYLAMSSIFSLPPILFVTFRRMYGISYTLLGTLVLVNFCTQFLVDLVFTFFAKRFNIQKTVKVMPLLTSCGMLIYALIPAFFSDIAYLGLLLGTVIFSVSAGLSEVLLSPLIAAIPSETPDRDMSFLHSLYAYGVVSVVAVSTLYLHFLGGENWRYLTLFFALLPLGSFVLFSTSPFPQMDFANDRRGEGSRSRRNGLFLCALCIFFGSAAENTMVNWISGFVENALHIPKSAGDLLGLMMFAVLFGLGRTLYAKRGKHIERVLLLCMIGAAICYLLAGLSPIPALSMLACVLCGLCTSMLWPGTLILMEEKISSPGVMAYALMAAGGDFGGSVAPQTLGAVVDGVASTEWAAKIAASANLTVEQVGMKVGMLTAALFPILGILIVLAIKRYFKSYASSSVD